MLFLIREIEDGRWEVDVAPGLQMEVFLLFSRSVALWKYQGEIFSCVDVGEA